ncbi:MAG: DNA primase [Candidatus Anoxychlamydiales bacterium]|nr:DNA primase [Candidatus Anoxychlamydiales bacterium]
MIMFMKTYTKESLERLRSRIDLIEVLSPYVDFSKSGSYFKAKCPFHDEKTPSFVINRSDTHYHCYGCSAHGDAISFLMNHQKMSFTESVEYLADKFSVNLELNENENEKNLGPSKKAIKEVLDLASRFYHFILLYTDSGKDALKYLFDRGIDLDFIKTFQIGLSLKDSYQFQKFCQDKKITKELLFQAGLTTKNDKDFFTDRIMIPIKDAIGCVIGFTARKYKEDTFGGKYINSPETILFKKSKVLFGLNYSRKNIAKQRKVIIVEGQIDAFRLIYFGFSITVASQGTAFTIDHAQQLINLGINQVYLALDSDAAGIEAAIKTGDLFQKNAIETYILNLPPKMDPDSILIEYGPKYFEKLILESSDYLSFLVENLSKKINIKSPSGKNELVQKVALRIKKWEHPLMVHESLRKLAKLTQTPEKMIPIESEAPNVYIKKEADLSFSDINPDLILETDLLRQLFLQGTSKPELIEIAKNNITLEHFKVRVCKNLYSKYMNSNKENFSKDLLAFAIDLENAEERLFLSEMLQKKINLDKIKENFINTIQKILDRYWMEKREEIKLKIHSASFSDDEVLELAKEFDDLKNQRPTIVL